MSKIASFIVLAIVLVAIAVLVGALITQWVWAWVVPDVFAGAVKQDMLPATLKYWQAVKLDIFFALLLGGAGWANSRKSSD